MREQEWMLCDTAGVGGFYHPFIHGFALWASPAVTHGVSPLGTVDRELLLLLSLLPEKT